MQVLDFNTGIDFGAKGNLKEFSPVGFSPRPWKNAAYEFGAALCFTFGAETPIK